MEKERPIVEAVYQKLMKTLAQAFYQDWSLLFPEEEPEGPQPANKRKKIPADFTGLGVIVINALLCRAWWKEEELAALLRLPLRAVRRMLRLLETHSLVSREHRKQRKRKRAAERQQEEEEEEEDDDEDVVQENEQDLTISYCSIDYQRVYDVTRLRVHKMRQALKSDLEDKRAIQELKCPFCERIYTTLNALEILRPDGTFRCSDCDIPLDTVSQADEDKGLSRKERRRKVEARQAALEEALRPLVKVLAEIENLVKSGDHHIPDFGTLNDHFRREQQEQLQREASTQPDQQAATVIFREEGDLEEKKEPIMGLLREIPPWLQAQQHNGQAVSNVKGQPLSVLVNDAVKLKDEKDDEDEYVKRFQERADMMAMGKQEPVNNQPSGWQEVGVIEEELKAQIKLEQSQIDSEIKSGVAQQNPPGPTALDVSQQDHEDDEDWEDA